MVKPQKHKTLPQKVEAESFPRTTGNKEHTIIHVNATVARDGRWWIIKVADYDISGQAAHLQDAESVAREITALWLDVEEEEISASVTPVLDAL